MKIAIISDCHFGFNEDALQQAEDAFRKALALRADAILLPGDIFDSRVPRQETLHESIRLISAIRKESGKATVEVYENREGEERKLKVEGIPLLAIWGTHERRSKGLANVIQVLEAAGLLTSVHSRRIVLRYANESIAIQGLGGVPEEYFGRTLEVAEFRPLQGSFNIFVFHQNLAELMPVQEETTVSMQDLPEGFDLYVNGHIHWNHDLTINGRRLLVPGSTVVTQMKKSEEKEKGFYLFDTASLKAEFIKIQSRPFFFREIELKNANAAEIESAISGEMGQLLGKEGLIKPLIRIKLRGTVSRAAATSLDLERIIRRHSENAELIIDRDFDSEELKDKIERIRHLRSGGRNVKELGFEILRQKLKEKKVEVGNFEELFELLAEGEIKEALAHV